MKTTSEELFEGLCARLGVECHPIPTAATRTADYELVVAGNRVVAEVKQLDPNPADRRDQQALGRGEIVLRAYDPGKRIRQDIRSGRAQIRALAKDQCPGLLVIFNMVSVAPLHTDPMAVLLAMYGQLQVRVAIPRAPGAEPSVVSSRFGPKRSMNEAHNTTISAVCVLYETLDREPAVNFYHNAFAAMPFNPDWLRHPLVKHYGIRDAASHRFEDWSEL